MRFSPPHLCVQTSQYPILNPALQKETLPDSPPRCLFWAGHPLKGAALGASPPVSLGWVLWSLGKGSFFLQLLLAAAPRPPRPGLPAHGLRAASPVLSAELTQRIADRRGRDPARHIREGSPKPHGRWETKVREEPRISGAVMAESGLQPRPDSKVKSFSTSSK